MIDFIKESKLEYCRKCGNPNPQDRGICECGGRNFIYGDNFSCINKKVICNCGNDKFTMTFHMNMNPIYIKNYKCEKCGNIIATQSYYENPYMEKN